MDITISNKKVDCITNSQMISLWKTTYNYEVETYFVNKVEDTEKGR